MNEDSAKPKFTGEINGITFVQQGTEIPESAECPRETLKYLPESDVRSAVSASDLDYEATYMPGGFALTKETAVECAGSVTFVGKVYTSEDAVFPISLARGKGEPVYSAIAPEDRIEAITVNGSPGVLIAPVHDESLAFVLLHDDAGTTWTISAAIAADELVRIAEGLER